MLDVKERNYFAEFPAVLETEFQIGRNLSQEETGGLSVRLVSQGAARAGTSSRGIPGLVARQDFGWRHQTLTDELWETCGWPRGHVCLSVRSWSSAPSRQQCHELERMQVRNWAFLHQIKI